VSKPEGHREIVACLGGVLGVLGAGFAFFAAIAPLVPGGIFAVLSSLSWLGVVCLVARR
jgi:hypothetical protein